MKLFRERLLAFEIDARPTRKVVSPSPDRAMSRRVGCVSGAQPEDIAAVVAFLAGPDGGWVNGQVLRANGGIV